MISRNWPTLTTHCLSCISAPFLCSSLFYCRTNSLFMLLGDPPEKDSAPEFLYFHEKELNITDFGNKLQILHVVEPEWYCYYIPMRVLA